MLFIVYINTDNIPGVFIWHKTDLTKNQIILNTNEL